MTGITLKTLSSCINIPILELIKNFSNIGIIKYEHDFVTLNEKKLLLHYLSSKNELSFMNNNDAIQDNVNCYKEKDLNSKDNLANHFISNDLIKDINSKLLYSKSLLNNDYIKHVNVINKNKKKHEILNKSIHLIKKKSIIQSNNENKSNILLKKNRIVCSNKMNVNNSSSVFKKYPNILNKIKKHNMINNKKLFSNTQENTKINKNSKNINKKKKCSSSSFKNKRNIDSINLKFCENNFQKPTKPVLKNIVIYEHIKVSELANKLSVKLHELIKRFLKLGITVTDHQLIDQETAQLVIEHMGHKVILQNKNKSEISMLEYCKRVNKIYKKKNRPPVVTIMGHVDHGKTSLLDYIRNTNITNHEFGGITQHIGAYCVETKKGKITFLDTPGHSAFTDMRIRGVQVTDIVVLVIAADDGIKPQTIESIQHIKLAKVPVIVAINKIDKIGADPEKIKNEITKYDILPEEWGGETIFVNISAVTGEGIDELLNSILLQSEILELSARSEGMANGVVIESSLDKNKGPAVTILVKEGLLKKGDNIICGLQYGRIRSMNNFLGEEIQYSGPSNPVKILGLSGLPNNGDILNVVKNEKQARAISEHRNRENHNGILKKSNVVNLNNIFDNFKKKDVCELNIIIKADFKGSLEAVVNSIKNLSSKYVIIKIISSNIGDITETDVYFAIASHAVILGFNVHPNVLAKRIIKKEKVDVRCYSVIYSLINDVKLSVDGMLLKKNESLFVGSAEIRNIFKLTKSYVIAGCMVIDGVIRRNNTIHIIRNGSIIYKGVLESLRRFKEDINEVYTGKECGMGIKNYDDIKVGDIIESFKKK